MIPEYRYTVAYSRQRPNDQGRLVVVARDADHAREKARLVDPEFFATTRSPRRGRQVR